MSATERRRFDGGREHGLERVSVAELEAARLRPLLELLDLLETRYADHAGHGELVGSYSALTGEIFGFDRERVECLLLAGTLHDIGKLVLDDDVLLEPGPLDDERWRQVRRHAELGADMLVAANLDEIARWVLAHHERPDGRGYPYGLSDGEIPLEARVLAVADSYDAMRTDRVYRAALSHEQAVEELRRHCGTQFDPDVVDALLNGLDRVGAIEHDQNAAQSGTTEPGSSGGEPRRAMRVT